MAHRHIVGGDIVRSSLTQALFVAQGAQGHDGTVVVIEYGVDRSPEVLQVKNLEILTERERQEL